MLLSKITFCTNQPCTILCPLPLCVSTGAASVWLGAGGTLSATRASSRASSRSGCTSGTLELDSSGGGSRRASRRGGVAVSASRAGAARTAAILLISRHLKAVRRDGGAHPPKCAAKGDLDNVCGAVPSSARLSVRPAAAAAPASNATPASFSRNLISG